MNETSITRTTIDEAKKSEDLTDLKRVDSMDESEIEANALSDLDNQPLTTDCAITLLRNTVILEVNFTYQIWRLLHQPGRQDTILCDASIL